MRKKSSRLFGRWIVKNKLQVKFALILLVVTAVLSFSLWMVGYLSINYMIDNDLITNEVFIGQMKVLHRMIFGFGLLVLGMFFAFGLFISNFVAGPIYRLEKTFEKMGEGDLSMNVQIRKDDELQDTVQILNTTLDKLREILRVERDLMTYHLKKMDLLAEQLEKSGRPSEASALNQILHEFKNNPSRIKI